MAPEPSGGPTAVTSASVRGANVATTTARTAVRVLQRAASPIVTG